MNNYERCLELIDLMFQNQKELCHMQVYTDESVKNKIRILKHELSRLEMLDEFETLRESLNQEESDRLLATYGVKEAQFEINTYDEYNIQSRLERLEELIKIAKNAKNHDIVVYYTAKYDETIRLLTEQKKLKK